MSECWLLEVRDDHYLAGLLWYNWAPGNQRILECHAAAARPYRGHWRPPIVVASHFNMVEVTGCTAMLAQCPEPLQKNVWRKLGYDIIGDFATLDTRDWHNGRS
jgi:hypothetical protein